MKTIAPSPRRAAELHDIAAKTFSNEGYFNFLQYCRETYWTGSSYDWAASRIIEDKGRIVAHVGVWTYFTRVGAARLKTGGIGAVLTHADYRKQGLASRCLEACLAAMREQGYDFSVLFGIRDFYHRFGFTQAWTDPALLADVTALPEGPLELRLESVSLAEVMCGRDTAGRSTNAGAAILSIYSRETADQVGTADRLAQPIYTRDSAFRSRYQARSLVNQGGQVCGYLVTRKRNEVLDVLEAGGLAAPCGLGQLMAAIREVATQAACRQVRLTDMPFQHPLFQAMRALTARAELHYVKSGGPMAAVVNLQTSLKKLLPVLSARLRAARLRTSAKLQLVSDRESVTLELAAGKVALARGEAANRLEAGPAAARLILGSESPATLAVQEQVRFTGNAAELAEALFPAQWPALYAVDHF